MNMKIKDTTFPSPIRLTQPKSINLVIHTDKQKHNYVQRKQNKKNPKLDTQ